MKGIEVISKHSADVLSKTRDNVIRVDEDAVIIVDLNLDQIQDVWRQDHNAIIEYKQQKIVIEDFFSSTHRHDLLLNDPESGLFLAHYLKKNNEISSEIKFSKVKSYLDLLYLDSFDESQMSASEYLNRELQVQNILHTSKAVAAVGVGLKDNPAEQFSQSDTENLFDLLTHAEQTDAPKQKATETAFESEHLIDIEELLNGDLAANLMQESESTATESNVHSGALQPMSQHDALIDLLLRADINI